MLALATALLFTILPEEGTIAFIAHTDDTTRLCLYDVATETVTPLGPGKQDREPRWSPDGTMIAFTTLTEDGQRQIALAHPDEKRIEILRNGKDFNHAPRWNAQSDQITYQIGTLHDTTIAVYDTTTNTETIWGGGTYGLMRPVWTTTPGFGDSLFVRIPELRGKPISTRSQTILAIQLLTGADSDELTTRVVVVTKDSLKPLNKWVFDSPEQPYLEWSIEPGYGDQALAYETNDGGDREIFVAIDGKVYDVTNHREAEWNPLWSPDSKWVAYETLREQYRAIFRSHRESGRSLPIAESGSADYFEPSWHPDSQSIVAVRERFGKVDLVLSTIDDEQRVLETPYTEVSAPQWRPR